MVAGARILSRTVHCQVDREGILGSAKAAYNMPAPVFDGLGHATEHLINGVNYPLVPGTYSDDR